VVAEEIFLALVEQVLRARVTVVALAVQPIWLAAEAAALALLVALHRVLMAALAARVQPLA
jgi:hypothetical protein